ncbi:MAG TPA: CoA transferase [Methylomirabilota bacterium]|nr:CoA transferase [Methylomirabilota bacterium]
MSGRRDQTAGEATEDAPLAGVRVVDFSRVLAGPLATMILADLGADVIKVERPGTGDDTRGWGPPFVGEDAAYFLSLNRNKRSVALDLQSPEGAEAARALSRTADVVVENFRPGLMASFGLDHETLAAENTGLVYCSLVAFSERGERASRPGYDIIVQALSGLMSFTGHPGGEPTKVGVALLDVIAGLYAANGIQAALLGRARTGRGRKITVSLFEASVAALVNQAANYLLGAVVPGPMGNQHPNIVPYQLFETADRPFILAAGNDKLFRLTCEVAGRPELADDPRFGTNEARVRNRADLIPVLQEIFRTKPAAWWLEALEDAGVPCAPVRRLDEVFASPEGVAVIQEIEDPVRGLLRLVADPIRLFGELPAVRRPPPRLGEHTDEVLSELGRSGAG